MPTGWSTTTATAMLNAARGGTAFTLTAHWIQLHGGEPGPAGTANVVNDGVRELVTFATAVNGEMASNATVTFIDWVGTTPPTHFSSWSSESGGTFQFSGLVALVGGAPPPGGTATLPTGSLIVRQPVAS